jgi:hypothetical protein
VITFRVGLDWKKQHMERRTIFGAIGALTIVNAFPVLLSLQTDRNSSSCYRNLHTNRPVYWVI